MTKPITEPRRLGRKPKSATGEPRNLRWPLTVAESEGARLDALPGSSNPEKIIGALDYITALEDVLSTLLDTCTNPARTSQEFAAAIDAARDALGQLDNEAAR